MADSGSILRAQARRGRNTHAVLEPALQRRTNNLVYPRDRSRAPAHATGDTAGTALALRVASHLFSLCFLFSVRLPWVVLTAHLCSLETPP